MENSQENKSQENKKDSHLMASSEPHQQETDGSSEESEENAGIGFGETGAQATSPALAGDESTDEDAADPDIAGSDTSKGFDSDQQAIDAGLDDGDLDNDVPSGSS